MEKGKLNLKLEGVVERINDYISQLREEKLKSNRWFYLDGKANTFILILALNDYLTFREMTQMNFKYNYTIKIIGGETLKVVWEKE